MQMVGVYPERQKINLKITITPRMETAEVDELISIFNVSASGQLSKVKRNMIMLNVNPSLCNL